MLVIIQTKLYALPRISLKNVSKIFRPYFPSVHKKTSILEYPTSLNLKHVKQLQQHAHVVSALAICLPYQNFQFHLRSSNRSLREIDTVTLCIYVVRVFVLGKQLDRYHMERLFYLSSLSGEWQANTQTRHPCCHPHPSKTTSVPKNMRGVVCVHKVNHQVT